MQKAIKESDLTGETAKITPKVTEEKTNEKNSFPKNIKCRKCDKYFKNLEEIKKHMKNDHKTYRPCKKFSNKVSEKINAPGMTSVITTMRH